VEDIFLVMELVEGRFESIAGLCRLLPFALHVLQNLQDSSRLSMPVLDLSPPAAIPECRTP
jgi:hypothetical protein